MSEFVRVCSRTELPPAGEAKEFSAGGRVLCVANVSGAISIVDNECPHQGGPLSEGLIENGKIVCPWHAWAFDLKTGAAAHTPNPKVEVYETKLEGDDIFARI